MTQAIALSARGRTPAALEFLRGDANSDFLRPVSGPGDALAHAPLDRRIHSATPDASRAAPRLLWPLQPVAESWFAGALSGPVARHGCIGFRSDGDWLFGTALVDDRRHPGGIRGAAQQIYADLFTLLKVNGRPHLLRLWNYIADINLEVDGVERYKQFNVGRQQAFLDAQHTAFDGAPAACALGADFGPLTVHFLAGPVAPQAVENPRQVSAYRYPRDYGPSSPTFSRAALVALDAEREALFISGTASIVGHATQHQGDVQRQTEETLANIDALLARAAELGRTRPRALHRRDALDCTVYVRRPADLALIRATFERVVGAHSHAARRAIYLRADICRADLLVEIEAQSIAGAATLAR